MVLGWSRAELAAQGNLTLHELIVFERGQGDVEPATLAALCAALAISLDVVFADFEAGEVTSALADLRLQARRIRH
jgi:transcriptional regulator with XRE-family HTH domain